jgi:microcin C transport system substrate-binding protein
MELIAWICFHADECAGRAGHAYRYTDGASKHAKDQFPFSHDGPPGRHAVKRNGRTGNAASADGKVSSRNTAISRRQLLVAGLAGGAASSGVLAAASAFAQSSAGQQATGAPVAGQQAWTESHGLSTFGELALPADFKHFAYVNPNAPKRGRLLIQGGPGGPNGSFETFDSLNVFNFRGDGADGMASTYDTLMSGNADEPGSLYGQVAHKVRISNDKLTYRFLLRPAARFHDGSKLTAEDAAFTFNLLKTKGHPIYRSLLRDFAGAEARGEHELEVRFAKGRSRDSHLTVAGLAIMSKAYWATRDFEAPTREPPLGSGAYKLKRFEIGRFLEFERVADYWGKDLPVNVGQNNFDLLRYEYFRERQIAFEAFKSGALNYREEFTSRIWHTGYDFPAIQEGKVRKETLSDGSAVPTQGWYFNLRRKKFQDPRVREAVALAFDFEWTNRNIMYDTYKRTTSFFDKTPMKAVGKPGPEELKLLEKWRGKVPEEVFGEPWLPPVTNGTGNDREVLRKASKLLADAGCRREAGRLVLPDGAPLTIEFLEASIVFVPHLGLFRANLRKLGIESTIRIVDAAQYKRRTDQFDFDLLVSARGGSHTPGDSLRYAYSSAAAKTRGSRNLAGISDPAIDEMVERVSKAQSREELTIAARVLDRLLRAGRYWIPHWYKDGSLVAYWDVFERPAQAPKLGTGAPGTWWSKEKSAAAGPQTRAEGRRA